MLQFYILKLLLIIKIIYNNEKLILYNIVFYIMLYQTMHNIKILTKFISYLILSIFISLQTLLFIYLYFLIISSNFYFFN